MGGRGSTKRQDGLRAKTLNVNLQVHWRVQQWHACHGTLGIQGHASCTGISVAVRSAAPDDPNTARRTRHVAWLDRTTHDTWRQQHGAADRQDNGARVPYKPLHAAWATSRQLLTRKAPAFISLVPMPFRAPLISLVPREA